MVCTNDEIIRYDNRCLFSHFKMPLSGVTSFGAQCEKVVCARESMKFCVRGDTNRAENLELLCIRRAATVQMYASRFQRAGKWNYTGKYSENETVLRRKAPD